MGIVLLIALIGNAALNAEPITVWDIGYNEQFDRTNKAYVIDHGLVTIDMAGEPLNCPTGLGHLASGRDKVKQIRFVFQHKHPGDYWLHISWDPGGSGKEQFEVFCNGTKVGTSHLRIGSEEPNRTDSERFQLNLVDGQNSLMLNHLSGDGLRFERIVLANTIAVPATINPKLKFCTLKSYENQIKEAGVLIDGLCVRMYAPKNRASQARIIFGYLEKAYDELYSIVGVHPEYKIVVYHFPPGDTEGWGGTSNCTLWYGYKNLDLESFEEWKVHRVPHVSGYVEEMAHNFVSATGAQFGWEMIGWTISAKVLQKISANPTLREHIKDARQKQAETFRRYRALGNTFPADLEPNLCDRIHAHILWLCERQYGPAFWPDFFAEIAKQREQLIRAGAGEGTADERRNKRYQITVECFDRICRRKGIDFKGNLTRYGISLMVDVKSLYPEEPGWNRKLH